MIDCLTRKAFLVFLVASLTLAAGPTYAQFTWKIVGTFPTTIGCGFFFDANHGLIGSGVRRSAQDLSGGPLAIYRTTDGGLTWAPSTVPTSESGAVTSIWMQNSMVGYASTITSVDYTLNNTYGSTGLWKTTDGGSNWFDPFRFDHTLTSVYGQPGLIVTTGWDEYYMGAPGPYTNGGFYSFDDGQSWITSGFRRANGVAFCDSMNGVVTEMNGDASGGKFWYTIDAGRSWRATATSQFESWSVFALPGTRTYFAANESQLGIPHQSINWSTDGGVTWAERYYFSHMQFTGTIAGIDSTLYIQTDTAFFQDANANYFPDTLIVHGMYRSDDLGATWHYVGGPSHSRDTRFVVTGCGGSVVYAFDAEGRVWKTTDGGDGTLAGSARATYPVFPGMATGYQAYEFPPDQDCRTKEGRIQFRFVGCNNTGVLDSAWITSSAAFRLTDPRPLHRVVSSDSVLVSYSPSMIPLGAGAPHDTAYLHLRYRLGGKTLDTTLTLLGWGPTPSQSNLALQELAVRSGEFGQTLDMPLVERLSPASADSLRLSGLRTLSLSIRFDPAQLSFVSYLPPAGLATSTTVMGVGTTDLVAQGTNWVFTPGTFDMGSARFQILGHRGTSSLIALTDLSLVTGKGGVAVPCLGAQEDNMWQVTIINTADVNAAAALSGVSFTPSPFRDHLMVSNSEEKPITFVLSDLLGRTVSSYTAPAASQAEWTTGELLPGSYIVAWQEHGKLRSARLNKVE